MGFIKIPQDTFESLQLGAGAFLKNFNPDNPAEPSDSDYITATTGGFTIDIKPEFEDMGEDVDNCPANMAELKRIKKWTVQASTTMLSAGADALAFALGASTKSGNKIKPSDKLTISDFSDLWWVGERADGGLVAVKIMKALSTGGLSIKSQKDKKMNASVTIEGHYSLSNQTDVPAEIYSLEPVENAG